MQHVVQFIGIAHVGPSLPLHLRYSRRIEGADFLEHRGRQHAPHFNRARPPFFERRIIQVGIGIRIKNFVRKLRRHRSIDRQATNPLLLDATQYFAEPFDIERLGQNACAESAAALSCRLESAAEPARALHPSASASEKWARQAPPVRGSEASSRKPESEKHRPAENYAARRARCSIRYQSPRPAVRS